MSSELKKIESYTLHELKKHIEANKKTHILGCLMRVKENQESCKRFVKVGGLELLVQLLCYQDIKIINIALSILANVCMNWNTRQQVRNTNITSNTLWILKNLEVNSNLHCRAYRLIGNLSDCLVHAKAFYDAGIVEILNDVLGKEVDTQTQLMAIRAVRVIWSTYVVSRQNIKDSGIIKIITTIFISAGKKFNESKYLELAETCMKAMSAFLVPPNKDCASQMLGENKEGFQTLVKFCEAKNKLAIKCMYAIAVMPEYRLLLGQCEAVEATVRLVEDSRSRSNETIHLLCYFCREAVNRRRIRYCSGLQVILDLLKIEENNRYHPMLLHSLTQFVFDDESILIMVENGLLDILIDKLKKMAAEVVNKSEPKSLKRLGDPPLNTKVDIKFSRTDSEASSISSDPTLMESPEVRGTNNSPENHKNSMNLDSRDEKLKGIPDSKRVSKAKDNKQIESSILILLRQLSYSKVPIEKLANPAIITPLIKYIRLTKDQKASETLGTIVKNLAYLIPLIKQGLVLEIKNLPDSQQYIQHLSALAQEGGAIGGIQSYLQRGRDDHRQIIAVSVPFLVKSKESLRYLFKNQDALAFIFDIICEKKNKLYKEAILSICQLAESLGVHPDALDGSTPVENLNNFKSSSENKPELSTVTFELDDGTTVDACRHTLCERSEAFAAMLEGNFAESGKSRVKIRNTTKGGLSALILAINGATDFNDFAIESLLDAVLLADRFLLHELSQLLSQASIKRLNHSNFSKAWSWARSNDCHELETCCVKSFLTNKMTKFRKIMAFEDFASNENFKDFLDEVKEIIRSGLDCA